MNILIIGGGGREHALAWKIKQSPQCEKLFIAPGNAGTAELGENVPIDIKDNDAVVRLAQEKSVDFVVVGPDDQLAQGMVDSLTEAGIRAFGPTKVAAKLEWSKAFAKEFMKKNGIPCAESDSFSTFEEAYHRSTTAIREKGKVVIKADGLALGKGVVIADSEDDVEATLKAFMVDSVYGDSGKTVVIEEFLEGSEVSIHAFCDGETAKLFPVARDHKRIGEGNTGANTGGMGTIAPVQVPEGFLEEVKEKVVMPVLKGMKDSGAPFKGILFPGLMITKDGFKVLEFNARFGDPECESYMRLLESDLVEAMEACIDGTLSKTEILWKKKYSVTVMMASKGYPGSYEKGFLITGIAEAEKDTSVVVFHAGTAMKDGNVVTNGGRVLGVSAVGNSLEIAKAEAYTGLAKIRFDGEQHRTDIGANNVI